MANEAHQHLDLTDDATIAAPAARTSASSNKPLRV
jgi:hypothetical protein